MQAKYFYITDSASTLDRFYFKELSEFESKLKKHSSFKRLNKSLLLKAQNFKLNDRVRFKNTNDCGEIIYIYKFPIDKKLALIKEPVYINKSHSHRVYGSFKIIWDDSIFLTTTTYSPVLTKHKVLPKKFLILK